MGLDHMENIRIDNIWPEWEIVREIGRGSFGRVYEAVHTDYSVESRAAIKVISIPQNKSEIDSLRSDGLSLEGTRTYLQEIVTDFVREIQLMESFKGVQNIVSVEDFKVVEKTDEIGWDIYIRMELLTPFNTYICDKTLSEKDVIQLGVDICTALELCAERNVIHRDIKPENIFINQFGHFKLGDFGIARKLENVTGGLSQKGTYNYMAPEVEKGTHYDARIDIYSLGLVLYRFMNKNRLPFLDTERQLLNPNERMAAIRRRMGGEPLPPPCDASPAMADLILCACSHNPDSRFSSAKAMKAALMSIANGSYIPSEDDLDRTVSVRHTTQAQDPNRTTSVRKAPMPAPNPIGTFGGNKKSRAPAIIASVLAVALLAGAGIFVIPKLVKNNAGDQESLSEDNAKDAASEETKGVYSDFDEERIASIIEEAEILAETEDYEGALTRIKTALITYPKSTALQEKEAEYTDALSAQSTITMPDGIEAPVTGSDAREPEAPFPSQAPAAPAQTQEPVYKNETETWGYATLASSGDKSVEALVLRELTANGKWNEYFDGTNSDVWLKEYPAKHSNVRQTTTITTGREFELFITNNANSYRSRTGVVNQNLTDCDMAIEEYLQNVFNHMYSELNWLDGNPVFEKDVEIINGNSWYVYSGYNSGSAAQDYFWTFFFVDESQKIAVEVSFEYVLYRGATLADASFFNEWYLNLSESLIIR